MPARPSPRTRPLKRKSFFVDEANLRRAKRLLGVATDADVVRVSIERVLEMDRLRHFLERTRASLPPGSFSDI